METSGAPAWGHPPSQGKVLPVAVQSIPAAVASTTTTTTTTTMTPWKLRDSAEQLATQRRQTLPLGPAAASAAQRMPMQAIFPVAASLARMQREKAATVQAAFTVAGQAVLEALQKTPNAGAPGENAADLPSTIQEWNVLQDMRAKSMERACENKEYTKKKDPKVDAGQSVPSSSTNTAVATAATTTTVSATDVTGAATTAPTATPFQSEKRKSTPVAASSSSAVAATTHEAPKFTRNTPASSAAALDFRFNSSRAILCAAGNLAFDALTPTGDHAMDVLDVPQNPSVGQTKMVHAAVAGAVTDTAVVSNSSNSNSNTNAVNMGAVVVEAQTLAQRTISVAQNAVHRSAMRYKYRKDNALFDRDDNAKDFLQVPNLFAWNLETPSTGTDRAAENGHQAMVTEDEDSSSGGSDQESSIIPHRPNQMSITSTWQSLCLPRFLSILQKGAGHAVYHDVQWPSRHGRIANLLQTLSLTDDDNMGPHLIVTTEPEVAHFAQEFHDANRVRLVTANEQKSLNVLAYQGSARRRRKLRRYFSQGTGLPEAPYHVIVTSYASFLQDYFHFCQLPFEVVVLDDGVSWMAAAEGDKNSAIGSIWDGAIWSKNDHQVGLAGTTFKQWDYSKDIMSEATIKEAWIGLTARHRVMTSSTLRIQQRQSVDLPPVSGLIDFVAPHFSDVVREEWDRSKITSDASSMEHFRQLMARSTVVHHPNSVDKDMRSLALLALNGKLPSPDRFNDPQVPSLIPDDAFISNGMVAFSRRSCLQWLGPVGQSWLRYELGSTRVKHILDAMKVCSSHGPVCEEITTASSTTSSGATGQVAGTMAYRLAVRCGRHFGSEQGLRQHISAQHAPPGTWLCRTCTCDCSTSQARTHHERSCGQQPSGKLSGSLIAPSSLLETAHLTFIAF